MKRAALLLAFLAGACTATPTPTRDELAQALKGYRSVAPTDITHIRCQGFEEEPTEFVCTWREREGGRWRDWQIDLAVSGEGWQTTDSPSRRP